MELKNSTRTTLHATHATIDLEEAIPVTGGNVHLGETLPITVEHAAILQSFRLSADNVAKARSELANSPSFTERHGLILDALHDTADLTPPSELISRLYRIHPTRDEFTTCVKMLLQWHKNTRDTARTLVESFLDVAEKLDASIQAQQSLSTLIDQPKLPDKKHLIVETFGIVRPAIEAQLLRRSQESLFGIRLRRALALANRQPIESYDVATAALTFLNIESPLHFDADFTVWISRYSAIENRLDAAYQHQPLGYLHLEKLSYTPAGIEHGELVASVPLAPGETVHLLHKEWTNTTEEFHRLVNDQFEDYSENGVVEKTELSESTKSQHNHSSNLAVAVSVSGGFGPFFQASTKTNYQAQESAQESRQKTINRLRHTMQKASSRSKREHRISFKLATKSHIEDQTVRTIKNPDPINPVRYDYYQLMRKWRIDLHRYGIRLTYDLTVPEPAKALLERYHELAHLESLLEEGFELPLEPMEITRHNYLELVSQFGVAIEPPPAEVCAIQLSKLLDGKDDTFKNLESAIFTVPIPEGYIYQAHTIVGPFKYDGDLDDVENFVFFPSQDYSAAFNGSVSGEDLSLQPSLQLLGYFDNMDRLLAVLTVVFKLKDSHYHAWQLKAYQTIRKAALDEFNSNRQYLEDRRARLLSSSEHEDALTLRKIEKEELMKATIEWLFPALNTNLSETASFAETAAHGKLTTFLHQAIEWENITYFLYPYFWATEKNAAVQFPIRHENPLHEAFLRAGSARLFLPIRPGWEHAFLSFVHTGAIDRLPPVDALMTIADQVKTMADETYPGLVSANPDEHTESGEHIATWYEFTPTSALDIKIGEPTPTEGTTATSHHYNPPKGWTGLLAFLHSIKELIDHAKDHFASNGDSEGTHG